MKKIGIFAGNFNPMHFGHIHLLKSIKKEFNIDEIVVVPFSKAKDGNLNQISIDQKKMLCLIATKNLDYVNLSKHALNRSDETKIVNTIEDLKKTQSELFLISGPSSLSFFLELATKIDILKDLKFISQAPLSSINFLQQKFPQIEIKAAKLKAIQSKKIRIRIALKKECSNLLEKDSIHYIKKNKLYHGKRSLFLECYNICKQNTSKKRFSHCNFVSQAAKELAHIYGENEMDAKIAGLLHDVMKEKPKEYMLKLFKTYKFKLNETQMINPMVWHGLAGALYLEKILEFNNKNIINAVKYHTVPRKNMSRFEKIVFMADRISEDRKYKDVDYLRTLVKQNLDDAVLYSLKNTISSLIKKESTISTPTVECYNNLILKKMENLKDANN